MKCDCCTKVWCVSRSKIFFLNKEVAAFFISLVALDIIAC